MSPLLDTKKYILNLVENLNRKLLDLVQFVRCNLQILTAAFLLSLLDFIDFFLDEIFKDQFKQFYPKIFIFIFIFIFKKNPLKNFFFFSKSFLLTDANKVCYNIIKEKERGRK